MATPDHASAIVPDEADLPVDPTTDVPEGYTEAQRGVPGGFVGDPDVMDTWATSSVTPQIVCGWEDDPALFAATFPMDLRPQGPEIIRTWLFSTLLRSHLEHGVLPWRHATINGWILDPDRKKISKSKGNASSRPWPLSRSSDPTPCATGPATAGRGPTPHSTPSVMKIGRRLAIKILNASKFALGRLGEGPAPGVDAVQAPLDAALLAQLARLVDSATAAHEEFDYARAHELTETFFWSFCDDYVELVKARAYGEGDATGADSARATLAIALSVLLRLFAPVPAFRHRGGVELVAARLGARGSLARRSARSGRTPALTPTVLAVAAEVLGAVRRAKTTHKRSMRARVRCSRCTAPAGDAAPRSRRPGATSSTPAAWTSWSSREGDALDGRRRGWPTRPEAAVAGRSAPR